ncbi:50S ribosomal protein L28 [Patescibacteria group bacterium]|nr:50S ribosomal protein L28 [Patescibacteria group bacterium]
MSKICEICGKGRQVGHNVSHSKRRTKRTWQPNTKKIKLANGKTVTACTRCLKTLAKPAKA